MQVNGTDTSHELFRGIVIRLSYDWISGKYFVENVLPGFAVKEVRKRGAFGRSTVLYYTQGDSKSVT